MVKEAKRIVCLTVLAALLVTNIMPPVYGQSVALLPVPGTRVSLSSDYSPPILKGIRVQEAEPLRLDFILDTSDDLSSGMASNEILRLEASRLIRYFLAGLTIPQKDLWVNLSPYERNRIIANDFGQTEMGRDLLAQDYLLKQLTSALLYPEDDTGKEFWRRVYALAFERYGTTDIPLDTFNKVWIMPDRAVVFERKLDGEAGNSGVAAYVMETSLKVLLETDYLAVTKNTLLRSSDGVLPDVNGARELARPVFREVVIPVLEHEINYGSGFSRLRQAYHSLVLATWYKRKIKESLLSEVYVDRGRVAGVNIDDPGEAEKIWQRYVEAFRQGAYNIIREEEDLYSGEIIPRKYFAGGFSFAVEMDKAMQIATADRSGFLSRMGERIKGTYYGLRVILKPPLRESVRTLQSVVSEWQSGVQAQSAQETAGSLRARSFARRLNKEIVYQAGMYGLPSTADPVFFRRQVEFWQDNGLFQTAADMRAGLQLLWRPVEWQESSERIPAEVWRRVFGLLKKGVGVFGVRRLVEEVYLPLQDSPELFDSVWSSFAETPFRQLSGMVYSALPGAVVALAQKAGLESWRNDGAILFETARNLFAVHADRIKGYALRDLLELMLEESLPGQEAEILGRLSDMIPLVLKTGDDGTRIAAVWKEVHVRYPRDWLKQEGFMEGVAAIVKKVYDDERYIGPGDDYVSVIRSVCDALEGEQNFIAFWPQLSGQWAETFAALPFESRKKFVGVLNGVLKGMKGRMSGARFIARGSSVLNFAQHLAVTASPEVSDWSLESAVKNLMALRVQPEGVDAWEDFETHVPSWIGQKDAERRIYLLGMAIEYMGREKVSQHWAYFTGDFFALVEKTVGLDAWMDTHLRRVASILAWKETHGLNDLWGASDEGIFEFFLPEREGLDKAFLQEVFLTVLSETGSDIGISGRRFNEWIDGLCEPLNTIQHLHKPAVLGFIRAVVSVYGKDIFNVDARLLAGQIVLGLNQWGASLGYVEEYIHHFVALLAFDMTPETFLQEINPAVARVAGSLPSAGSYDRNLVVNLVSEALKSKGHRQVSWRTWLPLIVSRAGIFERVLPMSERTGVRPLLLRFMAGGAGEWYLAHKELVVPVVEQMASQEVSGTDRVTLFEFMVVLMEAFGHRAEEFIADTEDYYHYLYGLTQSAESPARFLSVLGESLGPDLLADSWADIERLCSQNRWAYESLMLLAPVIASGTEPARRAEVWKGLLTRIKIMNQDDLRRILALLLAYDPQKVLQKWDELPEAFDLGSYEAEVQQAYQLAVNAGPEMTPESWSFIRARLAARPGNILLDIVLNAAENEVLIREASGILTQSGTLEDSVADGLRRVMVQRLARAAAQERTQKDLFSQGTAGEWEIEILRKLSYEGARQSRLVVKSLLDIFHSEFLLRSAAGTEPASKTYGLILARLQFLAGHFPGVTGKAIADLVRDSPDTAVALLGVIRALPDVQLARLFGVNIKVARYLRERGNVRRVYDPEFRRQINWIARELNREKVEHPAIRRLGEDQKNELFDLLFLEDRDVGADRKVFEEFFYNDSQQYAVRLEDVQRLLGWVSVEELSRILAFIRDDPKQSLEELRTDLRQRFRERGDLDIDQLMREFEFIVSNLFVLSDQIVFLGDILLAAGTGATVDVSGFLEGVKQAATLPNLVKVVERYLPQERLSQTGLLPIIEFKLNTLSKVDGKGKFIATVLANAGNPDMSARLQKFRDFSSADRDDSISPADTLREFGFVFLRQLPVPVQGQVAVSLAAATKRDPQLLAGLEELKAAGIDQDGGSIGSVQMQIPHIFFEPLLRLATSRENMQLFAVLMRAAYNAPGSSLIKNRLYEAMAHLSVEKNPAKTAVLAATIRLLRSEIGSPERTNLAAWAEELSGLLSAFDKVFRALDDNSGEELFQRAANILVQAGSGLIDRRVIGDFLKMYADKDLIILAERVGSLRPVSGQELSDLREYFSPDNPRGVWLDHEKRSIKDLLGAYLSRVQDKEVYVNMFDALLAEARGKFRQWKYSSPDYLKVLDEAVAVYMQELVSADRSRLETAFAAVPEAGFYKKLMAVEGFDELKSRVEKIRSWEETLEMDLGEGMRASFTDDYYSLLNIGNYPGSTACQSVTYSNDLNRGLTGYVSNATVKAATFLNESGQVSPPRRIVRLMIVQEEGRRFPAIVVEESEQFGTRDIGRLYQLFDALSFRTGLPVLVTTSHRPAQEIMRGFNDLRLFNPILFSGRSSFMYSDAYGSLPMQDESGTPVSAKVSAGLYRQPEQTLQLLSPIEMNHQATVENAPDNVLLKDGIIKNLFVPERLANEDAAMDTAPGGVDLGPVADRLEVGSSGSVFRFYIDPAQLDELREASGFSPVIIGIHAQADLLGFLGFDPR